MKRNYFSRNKGGRLFAYAWLLLGLLACAKKTSPEGGPYDTTPPRLVKSTPENGAVNVKSKRIKLRFNENVQLERQSEKVVFDPPQRTPPKLTAGIGKTITIQFEDPLLDSTTYVIDFSDAIVDLNEKNPIDGFTFAFSTGPIIDTLCLSGKLLDAQTLQPLPDFTVGIYKDFQEGDLKEKTMLRVSRTTETGNFFIKNLAPGEYSLFGIDDIDRSYTFTAPSEGLAFLSHPVVATLPKDLQQTTDTLSYATPADTTQLEDSLLPKVSSLPNDTTSLASSDTIPQGQVANEQIAEPLEDLASDNVAFEREHFAPPSEEVVENLLLFSRDHKERQTLQRYSRTDSIKVDFFFSQPLDTLLAVELLDQKQSFASTHKIELSDDSKTLSYWIVDSTLYLQDTLTYSLSYNTTDSLGASITKTDTLQLTYRRAETTRPKRRKSIFTQWRAKRKARQEAEKQQSENQEDEIQSLLTDSIASDSTTLRQSLTLALLPQPQLRENHPKTPLYLEFSHLPLLIDTTAIHLYYIKVDSAYQATSAPSPQQEDVVTTEPTTPSPTEEELGALREASYQGGGANPYDVGTDPQTADNPQSEEEPKEDTKKQKEQPLELPPGERIAIPFELRPDPKHSRRYALHLNREYDSYYLLKLDSLAVTPTYDLDVDTLELVIKTAKESDFGSLHFAIDSLLHPTPAFCELLNERDSVLDRVPLADTIRFDNIAPSTYYARVWFDLNSNGHWDAGSFPDRQPEPTYYYPKPIEVKAKFVRQLHWQLDQLPLYQQRPKEMARLESKLSKEEQDNQRQRRNLNDEYVARMKQRYGEKWNPTNRDRKMLGMPSRREEREAKKKQQTEATLTPKKEVVNSPMTEEGQGSLQEE